MSDTPRTDGQASAGNLFSAHGGYVTAYKDPFCKHPDEWVPAEVSRTLERENAALRELLKESDAKGKAANEGYAKICLAIMDAGVPAFGTAEEGINLLGAKGKAARQEALEQAENAIRNHYLDMASNDPLQPYMDALIQAGKLVTALKPGG